jgi:hypothetical protein
MIKCAILGAALMALAGCALEPVASSEQAEGEVDSGTVHTLGIGVDSPARATSTVAGPTQEPVPIPWKCTEPGSSLELLAPRRCPTPP